MAPTYHCIISHRRQGILYTGIVSLYQIKSPEYRQLQYAICISSADAKLAALTRYARLLYPQRDHMSEVVLTALREEIPLLTQSQNSNDGFTKWVTPTVMSCIHFPPPLAKALS